ncbi:MAG: UDP-N-acetylmuramoylalanyl-D-glutamate--2,6-diaminopimelate ligase [Magnetococcales bacterium]|nr:UDP-N-acetylmuramoylalanyl-D-glutamate--2,6-diaminopimelate ligase [Magnetococcales bacterium]HIJ82876.1 UDP-N-acetylmuramoyl-L-alanyl-D-glutamate--2,6-diaminopimelate ligase [Magnetococcales bacterium]
MTPLIQVSRLIELSGLPELRLEGSDREISGMVSDSRQTRPGYLFAALPGWRTRGTLFVEDALRRQAVAILDQGEDRLPSTLAHLIHPDPPKALSRLASAFHGHPSRKMTMAAITGTNGKTTVAAMTEAILAQEKIATGVIGTTGIRAPGMTGDTGMTTPDPPALHAILAEMAKNQCRVVVMEVSSHALQQQRTEAIAWHCAAFTNLSHDHLDYHGSVRAYFEAKARLFLERPPRYAIINLDDPYGAQLARMVDGHTEVLGFTLKPLPAQAPYRAKDIQTGWDASHFVLATPQGSQTIRLPVCGSFNIANAVTAAALAGRLGASLESVRRGLARFVPQPGRMEPVNMGQPFSVFVDYAHTPDALKNLLETVRGMVREGRIILVFGCGGNRDATKRSVMGELAGRLAHQVIVTDDNPRFESPEEIRIAILRGVVRGGNRGEEIADRAQAIGHALGLAQSGDCVLIVGKGHETVQISQNGTIPFDDRVWARHHLKEQGFYGPAMEVSQ